MSDSVFVTVVGAGPFGLSIAAHLAAQGIEHRIFGQPMQTWRSAMPQGMQLKSAPYSSMLHCPGNAFSLAEYSRQQGLPYDDLDYPVPLQQFIDYGMAFQARHVPQVENDWVCSIEQAAHGFVLRTLSGQSLISKKVVLATGILYFKQMPAALAALPEEACTHSSAIDQPGRFKGKRVAVVGGGSSAVDLAVLMREAGAEVSVFTRGSRLNFGLPWKTPPDLDILRRLRFRLRYPLSPIGRGWQHWACSTFPGAYRLWPAHFRLRHSRAFLGPAAGWDMRDRALRLNVQGGCEPETAWMEKEQVHLQLRQADGISMQWCGDHVVCATGFLTDLRRLDFLSSGLLTRVQQIGGTPLLNAGFESSVPGLHFVGPMSASSFGPLMRFTAATPFTASTMAAVLRDAPAPRESFATSLQGAVGPEDAR